MCSTYIFISNHWHLKQLFIYNKADVNVTFENVCRAHTKRQVIIKMNKFNMFITAVCVLFLFKLRWHKSKSIYDTVFKRYGQ